MTLKEVAARQMFYLAVIVGRPFGGIRPHRVYRWLAHAGFKRPDPKWVKTQLGFKMKLCPFYALDREILALGQYESELHAFYDRFVKPGMTCLDVGANIGDSALHLAQIVGPTGKVFAFEVAPAPLARLREHITENGYDDRVSLHVIALADKQGSMEFSFARDDVENQGMGSLVNHGNTVVSATTTVETLSLDRFVDDRGISSIDLIKVDIQGAELMFLKGARNVLQEMRPTLLMEVSPRDLECLGHTPRDLLACIESLGYQVRTLKSDGRPGELLRSGNIDAEFSASSIVCST